jgi:hypothetical protein
MSLKICLIVAAVAAALPFAAQAQALNLSLPATAATAPLAYSPLPSAPAKAVPDLANPLDPQARPVLQTNALDTAVFARTAVDHRFEGKTNATASLGFLCGLQPGHNDTGGAAAYGVDPHGRFVGARFSIAFR